MLSNTLRCRARLRLLALLVASALSGCGGGTPAAMPIALPASSSAAEAGSAVVSSQTEALTPRQLAAALSGNEDDSYQLGPNDLIIVSVYQHPELSAPPPGITSNNGGVLITSDGSIDMPLIGQVNLAGLTIPEAAQRISAGYAAVIRQPDVTIQLVNPQSLRYYLLGAFTLPGVKYPGHAMTLLDALALGGSVDIATADL